MFELFGPKFPKVSSRIQENSGFLETRLGDRRIKPVCTENLICVDGVTESPKLME